MPVFNPPAGLEVHWKSSLRTGTKISAFRVVREGAAQIKRACLAREALPVTHSAVQTQQGDLLTSKRCPVLGPPPSLDLEKSLPLWPAPLVFSCWLSWAAAHCYVLQMCVSNWAGLHTWSQLTLGGDEVLAAACFRNSDITTAFLKCATVEF